MLEVTFSDAALDELQRLPQLEQLDVIEPLTRLTDEELKAPREPLGRFQREGRTYFRLRTGDLRAYFELLGAERLHVHYLLQKNSFSDFIFRAKLPAPEERLVEQNPSFWKYLESLAKSRDRGANNP